MKQKLASLKMSSPGRLGIFVVLLAAFPMALGFLTAQEAQQTEKKPVKAPPEQKGENLKEKELKKKDKPKLTAEDRSALLKATAGDRESRAELLEVVYEQESGKKSDEAKQKQIGNELLLIWDLNGDGQVDQYEINNIRANSTVQKAPAVSRDKRKERAKENQSKSSASKELSTTERTK